MNITMNIMEVSTPFFHENNTVAMNSYEAPMQSRPEGTAGLVQSTPAITDDPLTNVMTSHLTRVHPQPSEEPVDTSPIPWRWLDRHGVPLEERGGCVLYSPSTFHHPTSTCLLYERDVVDNGTMTCLRSFDYRPEFFSVSTRHCMYGNVTMRAVANVVEAYRLETCGVVVTWIIPLLAMIYLFISWGVPIFYMIQMRKEENPFQYVIHKLSSMWLPIRLVCLPFMIVVSNQLEHWFC
jgi:hypothetical protein